MKAPVLESARLVYRPISMEHLSQDYVNWMNDPEVYKYLESGGNYTIEKLKDFLTYHESKDTLFWGIHLKENNLHIGNIKIDPVNEKYGLGEYGMVLGRKTEWNKGYAKEATLRIIEYCFKDLGLRKITLGVIRDNEAAYELYKKIHFVEEGVYKHHMIRDGKYIDVIRMAYFNPAFNYEKK